jgi:NifU-like protein involved in Fe-S cluster formation
VSLAFHLERPLGRGLTPRGSYTGAAGGTPCGDLVRLSVALDGQRIAAVGFDASGCTATLAAGSAAAALVEGLPLLDAARVGAEDIARELGGLSPVWRHGAELAADALHRALGAAARFDAALEPATGRRLVALSGGVDSAVAALLAGSRAVGVTLELWSDPQSDGESSCCSAQAVRGARALAHSLGMSHFSLDLRAEFRADVVEPWLAEHAAGLTPNPCVRCNGEVRLDAMLELAGRLGASALVTGHYARVADGLLRVAADPHKDQSYSLAAVAPESLARLRFPLGELRKGRFASSRAATACRSPASPTPRTSASWPAAAAKPSSPAMVGSASARARCSTPAAARSGATAAPITTPLVSVAASASAVARRSTSSPPMPTRTPSRSARARRSRRRPSRCATRCCTARALTACACATASGRCRVRPSRQALTACSPSHSTSPPTASPQGSSPA